MQRRGTVVLFLIALALVAYYALVERPKTSAPVDTPVVALVPDAVETVTIHRGDETVSLARIDTHWEIRRPLRDLADASAVMRLLAALATSQIEGDIGAQQDLAPYGLDAPMTVDLGAPAGSVSVRIGGYTVDHALVYAMLDDNDAVVLVPTTLRRYAEAPVEDFRFKRIATFDISRVDSFRVTIPDHTMGWYRGGGGWFTTAKGDTIDGDVTAVEGILRRLRGLRAVGFPPEGERIDGPGHPSVTVYRHPPDPPQRITVAPQPPSFVVEVQPENRLVLADSSVMAVFAFDVAELRQKHLLRFDAARVARIELEADGAIATILRSGTDWTVPNPALGDLDSHQIRAALGAAGALEFDRVRAERSLRPPEIANVTFRLALFDNGGTILDELVYRLAPGDSTAVATSRSSRLVVDVAAAGLRRLEERFARIRER